MTSTLTVPHRRFVVSAIFFRVQVCYTVTILQFSIRIKCIKFLLVMFSLDGART
ncbi:hypothetical protein AHAS_Ahas15G0154900 [Arachis hypogaea]